MTVRMKWLFSLCALFLGLHEVAVAGMSIKPAIISFSGAPGGAYKVAIEIQNSSRTETEFLKLYVESSEVNRSGNWEFTRKRGGKKTMLDWIHLEQEELALMPGEKRSVMLLVKVPRGSAGDYRVALMVDQDATKMASKQTDSAGGQLEALLQLGRGASKTPQKTTAKIIKTMRVAIPINVRIKDTKDRNWNRVNTKATEASVAIARGGKGSFVINALVNNQGDYDTSLQGACSVLHAKTKAKLKVASLDEAVLNILPVSERLAQCHFEGALPPGQYLAVMDLLE